MRLMRQHTILILLALMLVPALLSGQEKPPLPAQPAPETHGSVEFGVRGVFGKVYGRPDLPFAPGVLTSKFNEYGDRRTGFFIRKFDLHFDDVLGSKNYVDLKSQSTFYKNQSYLATFGRYRKFKFQFRYDEIPHIFTNTARSLYVQTNRGVLTILPATKQILQDRSSTICATPPCTAAQINISLPGFIATQVVPGENFITPSLQRKMGTGTVNWYLTPEWGVYFLFSRENEVGTRPIGLLFNSGPSASASGQPSNVSGRQSPGTGAEVPEPIDYFTNTFKARTDYGKENWGVEFGYTGSFFRNNTKSLLFDNPFATADVGVQLIPNGTGGCTTTGGLPNCVIGAVPSRGQVDLWPDNDAHYLTFAGTFGMSKYLRFMGTINPGWLRQNDAFLPYSANSQIFFPDSTGALTIPATTLSLLPAPSLNGKKQTLAMNYTAVFTPLKDVEVKVAYRHYDYNNNSPVLTLIPIIGDTIGGNTAATDQMTPGLATSGSGHTTDTSGRSNIGYLKKTFELSGDWFFTKNSSVRFGYEGEWFDRSHRDVAHSVEHSFFGAVDLIPRKDVLIRFSARHQDRKPDLYEDEASEGVECDLTELAAARTAGIFPDDHPCGHRFDESARLLNRVDTLLQFNGEKLSISGGFQTIQQDFNRRGVGSNSHDPLNFLTGTAQTTNPYFLYGALKDLSFIYTFDASYAFSPEVSLFAEYTHERYYKRMISRNRTPFATSAPFCSAGGCDSANNDWESAYRDLFDTYAAGFDLFFWKKVYLTAYYSLSAGKGQVPSRFLGDSTRLTAGDPDKFVLLGTGAAVPYPDTTTRIHELTVVFKYKLTANLMPKLEYRYQQFDNKDYQTSPMTPYMGCVSPATGTLVIGCPVRLLTGSTSPNPTFTSSPFYPYTVVGDTSAARFIFLGADQPSHRVHTLSATLEYRF
jgi:hypothetical protein